MKVWVCYSPREREVVEVVLELSAGATVAAAIKQSGLTEKHPEMDLQTHALGVWGRKARLGQVLAEGDRVEIYRPLRVDPKVARRERFQKQGARGTGLFAKRRPGAKPGY